MKQATVIIALVLVSFCLNAQQPDTLILRQALSKYDTVVYTRIVRFDAEDGLYHVQDYFDNGQIQMQGTYSKLDKNVKENYWCNYKTNTKQGLYQTWYKNGNPESKYHFIDGKKNGLCEEYYSNGQISDRGEWIRGALAGNTRGMRHGNFKGWSPEGRLIYDFNYNHGLKINPVDTNYHYLLHTPPEYDTDTLKSWPLIIYLHGGSNRGTDLKKLYTYGIPDQIYRGREFPFVIAAPQCPVLIRWSTDNWFENFYNEITSKYRIDTNRVYLTGVSLGGAGTWYLAERYPGKFAAVAPMSGFTSHIEYITQRVENLIHIPIWAFHGDKDLTVPVEETERMVRLLSGRNKDLKFTRIPDVGHWVHWLVYPEQELYDWFLQHDKSTR